MPKGIKRQMKIALFNVNRDISDQASRGFYAAGLSSEGYAGGYRQALYDIEAALNGVPSSNSRYWPEPSPNNVLNPLSKDWAD